MFKRRRLFIGIAIIFSLTVFISGMALSSDTDRENLLRNPSFEYDIDNSGLPYFWETSKTWGAGEIIARWCMIEARTGQKAWWLYAEGATGHTRQLVRGLVPGKTLTFSIWARGEGIMRMSLIFYEEGWTKVPDVTQPVQKVSLTSEYIRYSLTGVIPEGTNLTRVIVTTETRGTKIWMDDAELYYGKRRGEGPKVLERSQARPLEELINIAPFAKLVSSPFATLIRRMVDGDIHTGAALERGIERGGSFEFVYHEPHTIYKIRFFQRTPATAYIIKADTDGDGTYDTNLVEVHGEGKALTWMEHLFPPVKVWAVKFVAVSGTGRYRSSFPIMCEFEIYASKEDVAASMLKLKTTRVIPEEIITTRLMPEKPIRHLPFPDTFEKGIMFEPWMFRWQDKNRGDSFVGDLPFERAIRDLKMLGANTAWMWVGRGFHEDFRRGVKEGVLKEFVRAMHQHGIQVITQLVPSVPPFDTTPWRFPKEQTDRNPDWKQFPCIISADFFRDTWSGFLQEHIIKGGVDGVGICPDEYYYKGHSLANLPADDPCREKFKKRFGFDSPPLRHEDSEIYRKWVLFNYEGVAQLFKDWADASREADPNIIVTTIVGRASDTTNLRMEHGIALDIIGHRADIDFFGTTPYTWTTGGDGGHFKPAMYTKKMIGASKNRRSTQILNAPWATEPEDLATLPPHWMSGMAISTIMHGGSGVCFYRYNFLFRRGWPREMRVEESDKWSEKVRQAFGIMNTLGAWGGKEAKVPQTIALLHSRASEDWWQLKKGAFAGIKEERAMELLELPIAIQREAIQLQENDYRRMEVSPGIEGVEKLRGFTYHKIIMEFLMREGYPFNLYFTDQMAGIDNLEAYELLILPFPYSLAAETAKTIERMADKGAKVMIFSRLGEVDEYGTAHSQPVLQDLIKHKNVFFFSDDLRRHFGSKSFIASLKGKVDQLLGDHKPAYLNRHGYNIEVGVLEKGEREKFLFVTNWEKKPVVIEVGINMPPGEYTVLQRDMENIKRVSFGEKDMITDKDLAKFTLSLDKGESKVFYIKEN